MGRVANFTGIVLVVMGLVWVLQGFNVPFAPKSFMTGSPWWVWWGSLAIGVGITLIWRSHESQ